MSTNKEDMFVHQKSDELYVDEKHRRCPRCSETKSLSHFQPRKNSSQVPRRDPEGRVTWLCQTCRGREWEALAIERKAEAEKSRENTTKQLAKILSSATNRTLLENAAPTPTGALRTLIKGMGGEEAAWDLAGTCTKEAMTTGSTKEKLSAIKSLMGFTIQTAKIQGPPLDLSQLNDDEIFMVLYEPAKQMLLTNPDFRKLLLNDPDVRQILLEDAGVQLLEYEPTNG